MSMSLWALKAEFCQDSSQIYSISFFFFSFLYPNFGGEGGAGLLTPRPLERGPSGEWGYTLGEVGVPLVRKVDLLVRYQILE